MIDLKDQVFGRLTVVSLRSRGERLWLCRCECGNETLVKGSHLRAGNTQSASVRLNWQP